MLFKKKYKASQCGHKTKRAGKLKKFDEETFLLQMPLNDDGKPDYCIDCISDMTIKCAWCGKPIFVGDQVTLYSPADPDHEMPDYAIEHKGGTKSKQYVGCLRWECAETGADICGIWVPPGEVKRFMSPMEKAMMTGEPVIVSDTSKYRG